MSQKLSLTAFGVVLLLAGYCYSAALGADFQLDDQTNLGQLEFVDDWGSAIDFVVSGDAGPTGRPLALASFALQAQQWQLGPDAFLRANIVIHLCNALLLAFCGRLLFIAQGRSSRQAVLIGCAAASVWVLLPLLATSTLLVVQRMTTLSALFMLLGLAAYLHIRPLAASRPTLALPAMTSTLVLATVLAALCKESGLLLPVFILVLELTILPSPGGRLTSKVWSYWRAIVLGIPLLAILAYLASRVPYADYLVARRDFTAGERLLTEMQLLWVYLSKAVLGLPGRLGIYHEDIGVLRTLASPIAVISLLSWAVVLAAAILWRRRFPLFALAALWFLGGHLVESTLVPLELYFEHRNYVPIMGPIVALVAFLILHSSTTQQVARLGIPLLLAVNAWFLYSFASLHANPTVATRYWVQLNPSSARAVGNLVTQQFADEGSPAALDTLTAFVAKHPRHAYMGIQELNIRCRLNANAPDDGRAASLELALQRADFSYTAGQMLSQLATTVFAAPCNAVGPERLMALAESLQSNPRYRDDPLYQRMHQTLLASIKRQMGRYDETLQHLQRAQEFRATAELVMMTTMTLVESGQVDAAEQYLQEKMSEVPRHPLKAIGWKRNIEDLQRYVGAASSQE